MILASMILVQKKSQAGEKNSAGNKYFDQWVRKVWLGWRKTDSSFSFFTFWFVCRERGREKD